MTDYRTYYLNARFDMTFNAANLPKQKLKELEEKIENLFEEFSIEMVDKGLKCDIRWNWSEHTDI